MCELHTPLYSSSSIFFPIFGAMQHTRCQAKDLLHNVPSYKINQLDHRLTRSSSFGSAGRVTSIRYARMGSNHVELQSNHNISWRSMLLSIMVSHRMFLGFLSSEELASFDSALAWQFSNRGMCIIRKCFSSLVASHMRRT